MWVFYSYPETLIPKLAFLSFRKSGCLMWHMIFKIKFVLTTDCLAMCSTPIVKHPNSC